MSVFAYLQALVVVEVWPGRLPRNVNIWAGSQKLDLIWLDIQRRKGVLAGAKCTEVQQSMASRGWAECRVKE